MSAATGRVMRRRCARSTATTMRALPRRSPNGPRISAPISRDCSKAADIRARSEEHTSELQSLMRISYAVFCLKKKKLLQQYKSYNTHTHTINQTIQPQEN